MSADNGVYLLKTPTLAGVFEWRVIHAQAIDNIFYDEAEHGEGNPKYVVDYFGEAPVFEKHTQALAFASQIYDDIMNDDWGGIVEYGICGIELPHPFSWYIEKSKTNDEKE